MPNAGTVTKAFAQFKSAAFNSDGKYYLTYLATYVDTARKLVKSGDVIVACEITDNTNAIRGKIYSAIIAKGTSLDFHVPNGNVVITEFSSG